MKYFVIMFLIGCFSACKTSIDPKVTEGDDDHPEVVTEQDAIRYEDNDSLTRALIIDSISLDTLGKSLQR